jgi:hypothetical protein
MMNCIALDVSPVSFTQWRWKETVAVLILVGGAVGFLRGPEPIPHHQQTPYSEGVQPHDRHQETPHNERVESRPVGEFGKGVASFTRINPNLVIPQ